MIRSMTGYGASSLDSATMQLSASVRSLNHRYLDLNVHLSRGIAVLEREVKDLVQSRLARGKVDVTVHATFVGAEGQSRVVTHSHAAEVVQSLRALSLQHSLAGEVTIADVARFGVVEVVEAPAEFTPAQREAVLGVLQQALGELGRMREAEGANLSADLGRRLHAIEEAAVRIEALMEESRAVRVAALRERVAAMAAELGLEEPRLYQEIVRLVDRQDTSEETTRLRSHIALARTLLAGDEAVGKRMDFLAQELTREANTIGSKASSAPVIQQVIALKAEIEKLREQVQNVE
jgi:uncharacterized protein (TIGR00255 family)